ncbi:MAG: hypothetical protein ABW110_03815, partial [Steroidobacteraceae bacterium]
CSVPRPIAAGVHDAHVLSCMARVPCACNHSPRAKDSTGQVGERLESAEDVIASRGQAFIADFLKNIES